MSTVFAAALGAAGTLVTNTLPPVVVEASRLGTPAHNVPQSVRVFTARDVTAADAGGFTGFLARHAPELDVHTLGGANPAMTQLSLRGWGENGFGRLLVLVDGERINNPDMSPPDFSRISLGAVRQVELLSGPATVLHGDGASAGVLNVTTAPDDYETHGHLEVHGGSWGTVGGSLGLRGGLADSGTQYWANGGWDHSDGYRSNTGYDIYTASGGVKQNWENGSYLRVSTFYSDADYDTPGALTRAQWHASPRSSYTPEDYYRRTAYGLNVTGYGVINAENALRLTGTVSRRHMRAGTAGTSWGTRWTDHNDYDIYSYSEKLEWINTADIASFENEFIAGEEYRYDRSHNLNRGTYGSYAYRTKYELERQTMGFFVQDTFHLSDWWALAAGARYERLWNVNTRYANGRPYDLNAYEGSLLFTPTADLKAYLRLARTYRAPFLDEINYAKSGELSPEWGASVDLGAEYEFMKELTVAGDLFYSKTYHEIFCYYNSILGAMADNVNAPADVVRKGLETRLSWERDKMAAVSLGGTWTLAEFDGGEFDGKTVPLTSETSVGLTGRVWLWDDCSVLGGYRYRSYQWSASDFLNNGAGTGAHNRIPAYGIFHLGAEYAPSYAWTKGFVFGFRVDNLFDRNYCDYATYGSSYYPAAGRSYMFTVRYEF